MMKFLEKHLWIMFVVLALAVWGIYGAYQWVNNKWQQYKAQKAIDDLKKQVPGMFAFAFGLLAAGLLGEHAIHAIRAVFQIG